MRTCTVLQTQRKSRAPCNEVRRKAPSNSFGNSLERCQRDDFDRFAKLLADGQKRELSPAVESFAPFWAMFDEYRVWRFQFEILSSITKGPLGLKDYKFLFDIVLPGVTQSQKDKSK